jgi:lysine-N-methylase
MVACQELRLPQASPVLPLYVDGFRCIGAACEDTCCEGWGVPIDQAAYEKYRSLPASPLRTLIDASVLLTPKADADSEVGKKQVFARIRMSDSNQCPMLTEGRLCRIQAELGEELLSHACSTYPRIVHGAGDTEEKSLTLSCPEAARLVLLTPDLLAAGQPEEHPIGANEATEEIHLEGGGGLLERGGGFNPRTEPTKATRALAPDKDEDSLPPDFRAIRKVVLALAQNRIYPLWQRLFLLDVLCRRLDSIAKVELNRTLPDFLRDFEETVAAGALRAAMDTLPLDPAAQLDVVLRLAGLLLHRSNIRPRFVECVHAFTAGIGNGPGATLESLTARYSLAHDRFYEPFFRRQPHIMENYLINTIIRCQFPFGNEGMAASAQPSHREGLHALPSRSHEFALLAAQFTLMKGLLIGVAGFHGEAFSGAHVVHTVQAASKHFEHHPEFLKMSHELLVESRMDGARGLAILLRNAGPEIASNNPRPVSPAIHTPESLAPESKP